MDSSDPNQMSQSQGPGFTLKRKDRIKYEEPDMKQRPVTPTYVDDLNIKIP